jgi:hypothetical protein
VQYSSLYKCVSNITKLQKKNPLCVSENCDDLSEAQKVSEARSATAWAQWCPCRRRPAKCYSARTPQWRPMGPRRVSRGPPAASCKPSVPHAPEDKVQLNNVHVLFKQNVLHRNVLSLANTLISTRFNAYTFRPSCNCRLASRNFQCC